MEVAAVRHEIGELGQAIAAYALAAAPVEGSHSAGAARASIEVVGGSTLRLVVRRAEDLLVRLDKSPEGRVLLPALDDFELVNRSHQAESGSIAWFLDRAIRNLQEAMRGRGFDFSGMSSDAFNARDAGIREQIEQIQKLRRIEEEFVLIVDDASCQSQLRQPSHAVLKAHMESLSREFPECAFVPERRLESLDAQGVAKFISKRRPKTIVLVGAGASTSAGIPDFRTPGTGLYDNLQAYNLPRPTAAFELAYFREHPEPFYKLITELWPGSHRPTLAHEFIKQLDEQGCLLRCYTQNIDGLEGLAGISPEKVVEAHGHFRSAHGIDTGCEVPLEEVKAAVFGGGGAEELRARYGELVKPDVVFFGEALPAEFADKSGVDFPECELLIVIGTSLKVAPFNALVGCVPPSCPRVLINLEAVGLEAKCEADERNGQIRHGFRFLESEQNTRDVFLQGTCDAGVEQLCVALGW